MNTVSKGRPLLIGLFAALLVLVASVVLAFNVPQVLSDPDFPEMRQLKPGDVLTEAELNERVAQTALLNERVRQRLAKTSFKAQVLDRLGTFVLWTGLPILVLLLGRSFWLRRFRELAWTASPVLILVCLALATKINFALQ
jgi:hypothetical protein